jgi:hypothetical protein
MGCRHRLSHRAPTRGLVTSQGVKVEDYGPSYCGSVLRVMHVHFQGHALPGGRSLRPERLLGPDMSHLDATMAAWTFFCSWSL